MGQGVYTNIALIAARELGMSPDRVRVMATRTDKVPNTSATAASCGTDLNGAAVKNACEILRTRLIAVASDALKATTGRAPSVTNIVFEAGQIFDRKKPSETITFAELAKRAYLNRVS